VLWWTAPALFPNAPGRAALVRLSGLASAAITPLVATRYHDLAINLAALPGVVGFVTTLTAIGGRAGIAIRVLGWSALSLVVVNYLEWETGIGRPATPLVQKFAFAAFLSWVVLTALRLRGALGSGPAWPRRPTVEAER
jgi:hypothetical protein